MRYGLSASAVVMALSFAAASTAHAACQSESREIAGSPVKTEVCFVPSGAFKPSRVTASVNGKKVFKGTDYEDVVFAGRYKRQAVSGGCTELVTVLDTATMKGASLGVLPPDLVSACRITADADGNSKPFAKDADCNKAFYSALMPLLGKLAPASDTKRCTLLLDGVEAFSKELKL